MNNVKKEQVNIKGSIANIFGEMYFPEGFSKDSKYPAVVVAHPASSNSEQTSAIYAEKLAENGLVTIAYDATYQGRSGGEPRNLENPAVRTEDISDVIDYLVTLDFIDEDRIGALGICAGGGYVINAAKTEKRIKAVAGSAPANIGNTYRGTLGPEDNYIATLEQVAKQSTVEARGGDILDVNWTPNSPEEVVAAGITDRDFIEAVDYYRTDRGSSEYSQNLMKFTSFKGMLGFDANVLIEKLLTQPLQIIVGDKVGGFGSYRNGLEVYERAASKNKDILILPDVSHYDLYDQPKAIDPAVDKLSEFFKTYLV